VRIGHRARRSTEPSVHATTVATRWQPALRAKYDPSAEDLARELDKLAFATVPEVVGLGDNPSAPHYGRPSTCERR
jgi:hypothetical protein